jgi:Abnormal spindle-like microcephaly-assoc'd, ASPM-SPD-2-Hydin
MFAVRNGSFGVVVPLAVLLLTLGSQAHGASAPPTLTCQPCTLSFGNVVVGQSKTRVFTLTNPSSSTITISKISKSAPGFAVTGLTLPATIGGHQSISGNIVFAPRTGDPIQGSVRFDNSVALGLARIVLTGTGLTAGTLISTPSTIAFGNVPTGQSVTRMETIKNSGQTNVTLIEVYASGGAFSKSGITTPMPLSPSESVTFTARFRPAATGGTSGALRVSSSATNSSLVVPLSGNGTGSGTLTLSPAAMSFGNVAVGASKRQTASLTANGASVTISSSSVTSPEFVVSGLSLPMTLAAGLSASFAVTFAPQLSGTATANVSIASGASSVPLIESLTGTGMAGAAHSVALSWKASTSTVAGYNVYRGTQSGGPYEIVASAGTGTSYADGSVQAGQTYYYVVTAVNSGGTESVDSNQVQAVVPTP